LSLVFKWIVLLSLCWNVVSTLRAYPHHLKYFNEFSGGSYHGYRHLLNSNFDWGQNLLEVRKWIQEQNISEASVRIVATGFAVSMNRGFAYSESDDRAKLVIVSADWTLNPSEQWKSRIDNQEGVQICRTLWAFYD